MRVPGQPYEVGAWAGRQHKPGDDRDVPDSANPDSANPDSANPDSANPDSANPDSANPDSANPDGADARRLIVERLQPEIDGGRFPIKRTVGESVSVTVDLFADGHDRIAGVLKYRLAGPVPAGPPRRSEPAAEPAPQRSVWDPEPWIEVPLTDLGNDRWGASFAVTETGEYEYAVEGWIDRYGSWMAGLIAKADAGQDVTSERLDGAQLSDHDLH